MIVNSPLPYDLTLGHEGRQPQDGDNQLIVPNTVLPAVLAIQPTRVLGNPAVSNEQSLIAEISRFNVNQAASNDLIMTLPPGLFELEYWMSISSDFTVVPAAGVEGARILLVHGASTFALISRFFAVGSFYDYGRARFLFQTTTSLEARVGVTLVAQNVRSRFTVNAIRIL